MKKITSNMVEIEGVLLDTTMIASAFYTEKYSYDVGDQSYTTITLFDGAGTVLKIPGDVREEIKQALIEQEKS